MENNLAQPGHSDELVGIVPLSHHHLVPKVHYGKQGGPAAVVTSPGAPPRFR